MANSEQSFGIYLRVLLVAVALCSVASCTSDSPPQTEAVLRILDTLQGLSPESDRFRFEEYLSKLHGVELSTLSPANRTRLYGEISRYAFEVGCFDAALQAIGGVVLEEWDNVPGTVLPFIPIAHTIKKAGDTLLAIEWYRRAELYEEPRKLRDIKSNLAALFAATRQYDSALHRADQADEIHSRQGGYDIVGSAWTSIIRAICYAGLGRPDDAERSLRIAIGLLIDDRPFHQYDPRVRLSMYSMLWRDAALLRRTLPCWSELIEQIKILEERDLRICAERNLAYSTAPKPRRDVASSVLASLVGGPPAAILSTNRTDLITDRVVDHRGWEWVSTIIGLYVRVSGDRLIPVSTQQVTSSTRPVRRLHTSPRFLLIDRFDRSTDSIPWTAIVSESQTDANRRNDPAISWKWRQWSLRPPTALVSIRDTHEVAWFYGNTCAIGTLYVEPTRTHQILSSDGRPWAGRITCGLAISSGSVIVGTDQGLADLDLATGIIKPASVASLKSQSSLITSVGRTPMGGLRATRSLNTALVLSQASCLELSQQDVFSENKPFEFDTALRKRQPLAESIFRIEAGTSPRESGSIQRPTEYAIVPPNYYVWSRKSGIILLNGATANITLHQYSNEIHLSSASLIASFATSNGTFGILDSSGLAVGTFVKSSRGGGSILCAIRPYGETHFRIGEEGGRLECPADRRDLELITSRPVSWGSTTISESILLPWSREVVSSRTGRASIIGDIPPGDHSMKILCQDRSVPLHVDLHVAAFVHETWWFRISMVAILLGLITGTVRWFVLLRIRRRELREREMIEERIHIGQDLHDSIGAELVRINIAAMQGPSAGQNTEIARLAREASRQLRDVVWSVSDIHTLDALIAVICERVRTIGDETGITVEIHTKGAIPSIDVSAQRLRDIYLIMTEAMTNIVRHSKSTSARLTSEWSEQQFTISIEDHGCGFDSSITTTGRGITGMIKRAERSQLSFQCHSTPGSGTRVSITMRLHLP